MVSSRHVAVAASCLTAAANGFSLLPSREAIGRATSTTTELYGIKRRGGLGSLDSEEASSSKGPRTVPKKSTKLQKKVGGSRKKKGSSAKKSDPVASEMSPDLAKFLQVSGNNNSVVDAEVVGQSKKSRRQKQSEQREIDEARSAKIEIVLDKLDEVLEERTGKVSDILTVVEELLEIPSNDNADIRRLLSAKDRSDFRLAWVGSDEALCHVGTGLHKVPLARMQEVFMNCLGRNKIEILEVISIIGPFPNVKNVLQGTTKITGGSSGSDVEIVYDTMFDGTGKEIKSGTDHNIRRVNLDVAFCDERAIVAVVPDDDANDNALDNDGKRVLLFVREDELDEKLESLRVNELD